LIEIYICNGSLDKGDLLFVERVIRERERRGEEEDFQILKNEG